MFDWYLELTRWQKVGVSLVILGAFLAMGMGRRVHLVGRGFHL